MRVFWPNSLAGRLIIWLMLVFALALMLALGIHRISNERLMAKLAEEEAVTRITMLSRILDQSGQSDWPQTLHAATSEDLRFSINDNFIGRSQNNKMSITVTPKAKHKAKTARPWAAISSSKRARLKSTKQLRKYIKDNGKTLLLIQRTDAPETPAIGRDQRREEHVIVLNNAKKDMDIAFPEPNLPSLILNQPSVRTSPIDLAIELDNGRWLNGAFQPQSPPLWTTNGLIFLGVLVLAIGGVIILVVRAETRPMQRLAHAAEALGRGEHLPPLEEKGPHEIRLAVEAFNLMGDRLGRFMQDRTRMLAAMSHDLRTPLTTLRLRAEMIDEPEAREKLIETIEDMHRITEASLSFAREAETREETEDIDLTTLLADLCAEAQAMGKAAGLQNHKPVITARVRPAALRRAVRNLIDNAVRYGKEARLTIEADTKEARIIIEDDGPGIDKAKLEDVFSPFVRLENSRNTETGGTGLGLSIARTIARSHGGDVILQNQRDGGLRAILSVPVETG